MTEEPAFRIWTEGIEPAATVLGDGPECVMHAGPEPLPIATERVPVALAVWAGLGPRPVLDHPAEASQRGASARLVVVRQIVEKALNRHRRAKSRDDRPFRTREFSHLVIASSVIVCRLNHSSIEER